MIIHKRNAQDEECIQRFNSYQLYTCHVNENKQALPVCHCICYYPYSVYFFMVVRGGATQWLGGAVAPAKKKNFPLDYEEKIIRPPQPQIAGPPYQFLTHSPRPQSKIRNILKLKYIYIYLFYFQAKKKKKIELKSEKKKIIIIINK